MNDDTFITIYFKNIVRLSYTNKHANYLQCYINNQYTLAKNTLTCSSAGNSQHLMINKHFYTTVCDTET